MPKLATKAKEKILATQPQTPAPTQAPPPPQTIPGAPPAPPSGPAVPAAKTRKKAGLDLSGLSDDARSKVEALRKTLAEERKQTTQALAEKEKRELAALGVTLPERKPVARRDTGTGGINETYKISMGPDLGYGWAKDEEKAVQKIITDRVAAGNPLTLKEFLALDDVSGFSWFRPRFIRSGLLLNGKTFIEIVNKGAAA